MPKVFVLNDGGHDYTDAQRFGEIVFCTNNVIRKDDISQMYRELNSALAEANHDDLLLVSSLASLGMVASAILADRFGEVHLLLYKDGQYVKRDLFLEG